MNYSWKSVSREFKNLICPRFIRDSLLEFERARGGRGCTSEAFHGHTVVSNHPSVQQVHISISPSLSIYYLYTTMSPRSLRRRAFSRKTTDTPHIFPTFPPPAFFWWMLAGESSSCNRKILVFDFLELSRCVVYSVFWRDHFRQSLSAAEHQGRLGHQPQTSQVEFEFKFVYRFNRITRNRRFRSRP